MTGPWCLSLFLLTIPVVLMVSTDLATNQVKVLRSFKPINVSDANVKQCVWFAMQEYNNRSEDKYVFIVANTLQAELQITNRMEYLIHVQIARSSCRKPLSNHVNCAIQENSKLEKKANCSFLVGALPWNGQFTLLKKQCEDV